MTLSLKKCDAFNHEHFERTLSSAYKHLLDSFHKIAFVHLCLHLAFLSLLSAEVIAFVYFFYIFDQTTLALTIATLFLTVFSYMALFFYVQTKKPEQFISLKEKFIDTCKKAISIPEGNAEHHLSIAQAAIRLAQYLKEFDRTFYSLPLSKESNFGRDLNTFFHFGDVFLLKQLLLTVAIEEHHHQIRITATDMEIHASLANSYSLLSKHFLEAKKRLDTSWLMQWRFKKIYRTLEDKFRISAQRAVEQFKILQHYTPDDPWIHQMLAKTYQDLDMPQKEVREYEIIASFTQLDDHLLLRLGTLYFQMGENAKGLKVYENLQEKQSRKAEELISNYGCFKNQILSFEQEG